MTTKEYLGRIYRLDLMIEAKANEIEKIRTLACKTTVPIEGERVKSSPNPDKLTNTVAKLIELEKDIDKKVDMFIRQRNIIVSQIDEIEDTRCYDFLRLRFVEMLPMKEIKGKLGVEDSELFRTQRKALQMFEKKYGNTYLKPGDQRELGNLVENGTK